MADWTPPEAMVEEVAQQVLERLFTVNPTTKPGTERVAREVVRAALAASPIGELVEALSDIAGGMGQASPSNAMIELGPGEFHKQFVPLLQKVARAALARARGEK